jgi:hypothetical protein
VLCPGQGAEELFPRPALHYFSLRAALLGWSGTLFWNVAIVSSSGRNRVGKICIKTTTTTKKHFILKIISGLENCCKNSTKNSLNVNIYNSLAFPFREILSLNPSSCSSELFLSKPQS